MLRSQQRLTEPTLFLPLAQDFVPRMTAILSAAAVDDTVLKAIRDRIGAVPGGRADRLVVTTLDEHLSSTAFATERIAAVLVGAFAAIAIALGAVGLYGVMAESARRRSREFAMRLALGAQGWRVVGQVISEGMRLVMIGAAAGIVLSLLVARWIATISPAAGWPAAALLVAAPLVLAAAVLVASVLPARRSLSADLLSLMRDM
jgi:ABC-type antimicrobial peptide transport system permease subunit